MDNTFARSPTLFCLFSIINISFCFVFKSNAISIVYYGIERHYYSQLVIDSNPVLKFQLRQSLSEHLSIPETPQQT